MKKTCSLFLALALAAATGGMAQGTSEPFEAGGFRFYPLSDTEAAVSGCSLAAGSSAVVPATVDYEGRTLAVTAVGPGAFRGLELAAVGLPDGVRWIGEEAFADCSQTTFVRIPASVESIDPRAFEGCAALGHLDLPAGVATLSDRVLANCSGLYTLGREDFPALKAVGNAALKNCTGLRTFPLTGVQRIGAEAFAGAARLELDLSGYMGEVGPLAFWGCQALQTLALPAENPYVRVVADGQALLSKATGELQDVLSGAQELVVPWPSTGTVEWDGQAYDLLQGCWLGNLRTLEVPHTWTTSLRLLQAPQLEDLVVRAATPFALPRLGPKARLHLFDYAREDFLTLPANGRDSGYPYAETEVLSIDRPAEQLYMQEVAPMYGTRTVFAGSEAFVWDAAWNDLLEQSHPDLFMPLEENDSKMAAYRAFQFERYMTSDKIRAYNRTPAAVVRCLDGTLRVGTDFDPNDYVNWYMLTDTVAAATPYGSTPLPEMEDDPACRVLDWDNTDYALNMLPGMPYDIFLLVPPSHPEGTGDEPVMTRVRSRLTYNDGTLTDAGIVRPKIMSWEYVEFAYDGATREVLLYEDVEVNGDCGNVITVSTITTAAQRREGYSRQAPFYGFRIVPKRPVEPLPSGVDARVAETDVAPMRYDLAGRRLAAPVRGVNILRHAYGTTRKVLVP